MNIKKVVISGLVVGTIVVGLVTNNSFAKDNNTVNYMQVQVNSISDGEVLGVYYEEDTDSYSFTVQTDNENNTVISYTGVANAQVFKGRHIKEGDVLGTMSNPEITTVKEVNYK